MDKQIDRKRDREVREREYERLKYYWLCNLLAKKHYTLDTTTSIPQTLHTYGYFKGPIL